MKLMPASFCLRHGLSLCALALGAFAGAARAATITVSWGSESEARYFANASGELLPTGSLVLLGAFAAGTDFAGHASDYGYLAGQFTLFGTAYIGDGGFGYDGALAAASAVDALDTQLSYWAFNAPTAAAATQWGIFTQTAGLWTTPVIAPGSMNTDIADANLAYVGSLVTDLALTTIVNPGGGGDRPVPDGSFLALDLLAAGLALYLSRRLRHQLVPS